MKTTPVLCFLGAVWFPFSALLSQDDHTNVNLLAAPSTPAAMLLGFSPSEVARPRDPSEFLASVVNNPGGEGFLPANYAVELAPAWLFTGKKIDFQDFRSKAPGKSLWQGFTISAAVRTTAATADTLGPLTQVAFGVKTSILRGHRFSQQVETRIAEAQSTLRTITKQLDEYLKSDSLYQVLIDRAIDEPADTAELNRYRKQMYESFSIPELEKLETALRDLSFDRVGFKLDLTVGVVQDFPNGRFADTRISKAGAWLSGGFEWEKGFSFLGIARYLSNPDATYTDDNGAMRQDQISTFDAGFRAILAPAEQHFTVSAEGIYRKMIEPEVLPASWRLTLNAEYKFRPNMSLNFSYGRDFDGTVTRDGNVIALLSLFTGFGNAKPLVGK